MRGGYAVAFISFGIGGAAMQPLEQKFSGLIRANTSGAPHKSLKRLSLKR